MERTYWLSRERDSLERALTAKTAESRLIHFDLAGRYSLKAASIRWAPVGDAPADAAQFVSSEQYGNLEAGARWLASRSPDQLQRVEHLTMANKYARLKVEAVCDERRDPAPREGAFE